MSEERDHMVREVSDHTLSEVNDHTAREESDRTAREESHHTSLEERDHTARDQDQNVQQSTQLIPTSDRDSIVPSLRSSATQSSKKSSKTPRLMSSWTHRRSTITLIVVFFIAAILLAVAHGVFYNWLDGTFAEHRLLEQSQVIAISLLITTLFKACLVASVGLAFTQHLWKIFRQKLLRISQIEQLFHIRSNPLELAKVKIVKDTPLLFLMAIFVWLLPIAVVYPPSSLTVTSRPYSEIRSLDLSVMNLPPPEGLDYLHPNNNSVPSLAYLRRAAMPWAGALDENTTGTVAYDYVQPSRPLLSLAKLVLLTGEILEFPSPKIENLSYALEYRTPQVVCRQEAYNWSYFGKVGELKPVFTIDWDNELSYTLPPSVFNISNIQYPGLYSFNDDSLEYEYAVSTESLICELLSTLMSVNISYIRGVRHVDHVLRDVQPMPNINQSVYEFPWGNGAAWPNISDVPTDTPEYADWVSRTRERLTNWDILAPMDASFLSLNHTWEGWLGEAVDWNYTRWNGTLVPLEGSTIKQSETIIEWSAFNTQRYNVSSEFNTVRENPSEVGKYIDDETLSKIFDPRRDLDLSESMINAFLINVSISALNLNTWLVQHPVDVTEYRTTYHFSRPINLILPYALSIFLALGFVVIGIWSLVANGVPATDGGFLQIVTTTTGRTEMEKLIEKNTEEEGEKGKNGKDLLSMRIRYGKLVDEGGEDTGRVGFGMLTETRPLGKQTRDE